MRATIKNALACCVVEVESFESAESFMSKFDMRTPGCMIVDINLPGMNGLEMLDLIKHARARFPAIILSGHGSVSSAVWAGRLGVVNFVEKPFRVGELLTAVNEALDDLTLMAESPSFYLSTLSSRETEVLRCLSLGAINKGVAHELGISVRTVEVYRANIMKKLKVRTLAQAILVAREGGYV